MPQLLSLVSLQQSLHQAPPLVPVLSPTTEQSSSIQSNPIPIVLDHATSEDNLNPFISITYQACLIYPESPIQFYDDEDVHLYSQGDYADHLPDPPGAYENQPATPPLR
ncbi:hypothetical protein EDD22DRAFT_960996 [Suillus occidentalis]|nr:hypothetical protein EDD22DRAFT_854356 [Suillus occidentalis]KAG1728823.1 hypothetical protein EDD22DRAFT_960996 [Suillus occidentalis]